MACTKKESLEVVAVNSYILYKLNTITPITHMEYCRKVLETLALQHIQSAPPLTLAGRPQKRQYSISTGDSEWLNEAVPLTWEVQQAQVSVLSAVILQKARDTEVSTIVPLVHLTPCYVLRIASNSITHKNYSEFIIFSCLFHLPA